MAKVMRPIGARIVVEELKSELTLTERGKLSNIVVVTDEQNQPHNTMGKVVALGTDPMVHEVCKEGDTVFFNKHAGVRQFLEGRQFRILDFPEILSVLTEEEVLAESKSQLHQEPIPSEEPQTLLPSQPPCSLTRD